MAIIKSKAESHSKTIEGTCFVYLTSRNCFSRLLINYCCAGAPLSQWIERVEESKSARCLRTTSRHDDGRGSLQRPWSRRPLRSTPQALPPGYDSAAAAIRKKRSRTITSAARKPAPRCWRRKWWPKKNKRTERADASSLGGSHEQSLGGRTEQTWTQQGRTHPHCSPCVEKRQETPDPTAWSPP